MLALDLVSPLPPVRSGIADYSLELLPRLAELADVRVIRLPGQPLEERIAERFQVAAAAAVGEGGGRLPLYQMGNNRHHEGVLELALRHPGVLTLHDVVLHHLLLDLTLGRGDFYGYKQQLTRDHGWIGEAVAVAKRWGAYATAPIFALPAHRTLLARQRGVLVHSAWAAGAVREENPGVRVRVVPMGVPLPAASGATREREAGRALRRRHGVPEVAPVLGSFGFQTPIKLTTAGVRALAAPGLESLHLLVVGEESAGSGLLAAAHRAGVAERVHVTGYLPFADFTAAIAASDLCLNLRYPTAGETSASLLRVMAAGRPAVVSDYAEFAELPGEVAVKVPLAGGAGSDPDGRPAAPGERDALVDEAALAAVLAGLFARPQRLLEMGAAARDHVRLNHDPRRAAAAVAAACAEWASAAPAAAGAAAHAAAAVAPPPSSLTCGRLAGEVEVRGAELPWPEGERRRLEVVLRNRGPARWLAGDRGPGGIAVAVKLFASGRDLFAGRPWLPLPRDLPPGEEACLQVEVRRPPGPPGEPWPPGVTRRPLSAECIRLWIEPHLFGGVGLSQLGGPRWERDI